MTEVQTLTLNRKKFAVMPYAEYQKLIEEIEDLKDLTAIKQRAKEPRIPFETVKEKFVKSRK